MKHDYDRTVTRLITILSKFSHNEIVNPKDLAEEFNVSVRTIQKDLKEKLEIQSWLIIWEMESSSIKNL